jgi:hypothetical protein
MIGHCAYGTWTAGKRFAAFPGTRVGCRTWRAGTSRSFWLNGSAWEYPDFQNAEIFLRKLADLGLIAVDASVIDVVRNQRQVRTLRTTQRRFLQATGLTHSKICQIERARLATSLLKQGDSILDTVHNAGYYDQAHLTRSLKRWIGQTALQIARAEQQLSLLYNPESD